MQTRFIRSGVRGDAQLRPAGLAWLIAVLLAGGAFAWGRGVPVAMTLPVTAGIVRLCGTDASEPRCIALAGEIGQAVRCTIYAERPSPCREFDIEHAACNRARQRHGLPPL